MSNRTIKFRAWYPTGRTMLNGIANRCVITFEGKLLVVDNISGNYIAPQDYVLMQFTGLCDKNGKHVYEGDIVKVYDMNRGCYCEDEVDGNEPAKDEHRPDCECYITTQEVKWLSEGGYVCKEDTGDYCPLLGADEIELEIIGNIYENPELLKQ